MDHLHSDIFLNIISRVPTESVLECKLVCKSWGNLLRKKYSIDVHVRRQINQLYADDVDKMDIGFLCTGKGNELNRYELLYYGRLLKDDKINTDDDEDYNYKAITLKEIIQRPSMPSDMRSEYLVGSCNGLVCLGRYYNSFNIEPIYIFNPITGDYSYLPKFLLPAKGHPINHRLACGFGYVGSTNEYKVVRIYYADYGEGVGQVQVYTLGRGCGWRNKCMPFPQVDHRFPGTFANGTIYWVWGLEIHAFNLANEEYQMVSSPPCNTIDHWSPNFGLVVLGRNLCFFNQNKNKSAPHIEIWTLKKTDMNETWSRDFNIVYGINERCPSYDDTLKPILLTKRNEVIFTSKTRHIISICNYETFCCYDADTETWRVIWDDEDDPSLPFGIIRVIPHVSTFVSIKALGEKTQKTANASLLKW